MLSCLVIVNISHEKCTRNPFFFFFLFFLFFSFSWKMREGKMQEGEIKINLKRAGMLDQIGISCS